MKNINCLDDMLQSEDYQVYESETLLNIQYHIINTDKDIDKMLEANENGNFGCIHGEFIETWRNYLDTLRVWESKCNLPSEKQNYDITKKVYNKIFSEISECEKYHLKHNTYNQMI